MSTTPPTPSSSVTELALLTLPPAPLSGELLAALGRAKTAMQRVSGQRFAYVLIDDHAEGRREESKGRRLGGDLYQWPQQQQQQQQQQMFIVGGWPSVKSHMEEWVPGEENQGLVRDLGGLGVGVRWMWHVGVGREEMDSLVFGGEGGRVRVWRGAVVRGKVGTVERLMDGLELLSGLEGVVGGWRIDDGYLAEGEESYRNEEEGRDEIVVFMRVDDKGAVVKEVDNVLGEVKGLSDMWKMQEGMVLAV